MRNGPMLAATILCVIPLAGCGTATLPEIVETGDALAAERAISRSVEAHGGSQRWDQIETVRVRYEGEWASIGPRLQPELSDTSYRLSSTEVIVPSKRIVRQEHEGKAGRKRVLKTPESIEVWYDGVPTTDRGVLDAAALVADAYQMFLTGPFFFDRHASSLKWAGRETIDGEICDQISAVVRPGFGRTKEDLALLSIGRETGILRRVRFTLNGTEPTEGAEVDVTFRAHKEIDGILWATEYVERIRAPLRLPAHRWRLVSLETNEDGDPRLPE